MRNAFVRFLLGFVILVTVALGLAALSGEGDSAPDATGAAAPGVTR